LAVFICGLKNPSCKKIYNNNAINFTGRNHEKFPSRVMLFIVVRALGWNLQVLQYRSEICIGAR